MTSTAGRSEAGRELRKRLLPRRLPAFEVANALAPPGPGPGVRYSVYQDGTLRAATRSVRFQEAFAEPEAWLDALGAGDPGAVELAVEVLSRVEPDELLAVAPALLGLPPWSGLWYALGRALARSRSALAFDLLLAHALDHTGVGLGLGASEHPDGAEAARARFDAIPAVMTAEVDPRQRILGEGLVGYLVRHGGSSGRELGVRVFREATSALVHAAGHALWARGAPDDLEVLAAAIDDPARARRWFATRAHLRRDPAHAIDALGGVDALTRSPRAALLLEVVGADAHAASRNEGQGWLSPS